MEIPIFTISGINVAIAHSDEYLVMQILTKIMGFELKVFSIKGFSLFLFFKDGGLRYQWDEHGGDRIEDDEAIYIKTNDKIIVISVDNPPPIPSISGNLYSNYTSPVTNKRFEWEIIETMAERFGRYVIINSKNSEYQVQFPTKCPDDFLIAVDKYYCRAIAKAAIKALYMI